MKSLSIVNIASVATLAAVLPLATYSAHAVSAPTEPLTVESSVQAPQFQRVEWTEERRAQLRRAFWLLEHSDADYNGHRVKAMEHVKRAGEALGMDLHGKGYGEGIKQAASDDRMREARHIIQEVAKESGPKEREILHKAVGEINESLGVH